MKILVVSSEVVPFAKTGGLADVSGALPRELAALGHEVKVVMPKYRAVDDGRYHLRPVLDDITIKLGTAVYKAGIRETTFPDTNVAAYFVQNALFFDRDELYVVGGHDYPDNAMRFAFFCRAVIWLMRGLGWTPHILQCNDWQTALVPVYLRNMPGMKDDPDLARIRVLYTIHNLAYQGLFPAEDAPKIDIGPDLFHMHALEFWGRVNLMKGGIVFSDRISTVSRRYAEEIQTPEFGAGLDGVLRSRAKSLVGILNGIDQSVWDPATDRLIPANYTHKFMAGKAVCKAALQRQTGLDVRPEVPLIGIISRLDKQKGFDLIGEVLDTLLAENAQFVLLGTGDPEYHETFEAVGLKHGHRFSVNLKFDNTMAHLIEAGSDMFLMPSRYEPCGLNQLYSLKYGTIPIVRRTGGLADSITDATRESIASGAGTGFVFDDYTGAAMLEAVRRALAAYAKKTTWKRIVKNAMARDFSWRASALEYVRVFQEMM